MRSPSRGVCVQCGHLRLLAGKNGKCKPCGYEHGRCVTCGHQGTVYVAGLCYGCYEHRLVERQIGQIESDFRPKSSYNQHVFGLYMTYIRRYDLRYFHVQQAKRVAKVLECDEWQAITRWSDVAKLSRQYKLWHGNRGEVGCAVIKIGRMLEELGVLASKNQDLQIEIDHLLSRIRLPTREWAESFIVWLRKSGRTDSTIVNNLRAIGSFERWLESVYPGLGLWSVSESKVIEYLENMRREQYSSSEVGHAMMYLRRFFAWLLKLRKVFLNPAAQLSSSPPRNRVVVLEPAGIERLIDFIKNPNSDPEDALILALILYFGFSTDDLLNATINFEPCAKAFSIVLGRRPRSCGRQHFNRQQVLLLPAAPPWFGKLQTRFLDQWKSRYQAVKQTFPTQRLILARRGIHTRPICQKTLVKRVRTATIKALGVAVSASVLRQTCGHLYSGNGDASLLSRLGWAPESAFRYTWVPRELVSATPADQQSTAT
jgi:integrase